jgi:hypothetical protein
MKPILNQYEQFRNSQPTTIRGGVLYYDVKGHYKFLTEAELFEYYLKNR